MSSAVGQHDGVIGAWLGFSLALSGVALALAVLRLYVAKSVVRRWFKDDGMLSRGRDIMRRMRHALTVRTFCDILAFMMLALVSRSLRGKISSPAQLPDRTD